MLGQRVRKARQAARMTQEQLAAATGLKQFHISRIERGGIKDVMGDTLRRLSHALSVSIDFLLDGGDTEQDSTDDTPVPQHHPISKRGKN